MTKFQQRKFEILLLFSIFYFLFSHVPAWAALLYLEPSNGRYQPGDTFMIDVKIDTEGECINAVEANLGFSNDILQAVDFSRGESILNIWVKNPQIQQEAGLISFSGGIPGGYCGRIPGDPGTSDSLGKIIFKIPGTIIKEPGENISEVKFLDSSQVLLNDGLGTPADLKTKGAIIDISGSGAENKNEWQEEIAKDNIPPELFSIEIHQYPLIFEGKYFIIFSTTDKQTGIDHYEVAETREGEEKSWKKGESPYLLEDQELKSIIEVKAIDNAGNERIMQVVPEIVPEMPKKPFPWWAIFVIVISLVIISWIAGKFLISKSQFGG